MNSTDWLYLVGYAAGFVIVLYVFGILLSERDK